VVLGALLCARLGIWQLDRLAERRAFNSHYLATSALPPLRIDATPALDLTQMEYRPAVATGTYDFDRQVALRDQYYNERPGYFLLTPLRLADGTAILIERGWIPADGNPTAADWHRYDQPGTVTVKGILRSGTAQPELGGIADPTLAPGRQSIELWNIVNTDRIAAQLPYRLLPVFLQPNPDPARAQPPYPFQPEITIDEGPHLGYALEWFSFAMLLLFGYPLFYLRTQVKTEAK
jgi:surfeit locus 1 family protein